LCRREGMKLFLKAAKCYTDKCPIERRNYAPGQHGKDRRPKVQGYGLQLREKQKVRRIYGILERQFRNYFDKAVLMKGVTGENLLQLLERRMDNVVYRMGLGGSRAQARQVVLHGHMQVNGRKVNVPSFLVKVGDVIEVREGRRKAKNLAEARGTASSQQAPPWLEVDRENLRARVVALPRREDTNLPIQEQLIVELYSK
jgi:small subunit ribosomal protein S4